jgi:hypothetical protein
MCFCDRVERRSRSRGTAGPREGAELPKAQIDLLPFVGLGPRTEGLNSVEVYDSIYNPRKALVLASWADAAAADAFRLGVVPNAETVCCRAVRVISDYGMFDRREAPQYYRDVRQGPE